MGRRGKKAPRRGSLAYLPRGRAKRPVGKINYWPEVDSALPKLIGFSGYKVGMSFVHVISEKRGSPIYGQEIQTPVTFIETPPMIVCGFRSYSKSIKGLKAKTEVWTETPPKNLKRVFTLCKKPNGHSLKNIEANLEITEEFRAILCTEPSRCSVPQKKPELFEVKVVGGSIHDQFEFLKNLLGKEINVSEIFEEGQLVDVIAITKGKGIQGPVKRWGVKTLPHKSRKTVRGVGTLGPWTPHYVMYSVPRAGQTGFHQRTELNKRILKIEKNAEVFAPKGGFPHYGLIRSPHIVLEGSVPGPIKRLIKLRYAIRSNGESSPVVSKITYMGIQVPKIK